MQAAIRSKVGTSSHLLCCLPANNHAGALRPKWTSGGMKARVVCRSFGISTVSFKAPALMFEGTLALTAVTDNLLSGLAEQ